MNPQTLRTLRREAADSALAGQFKRAAQLYARILSVEPDAHTALRLAHHRVRAHDLAGACEAAELAISLFEAAGLSRHAEAARGMLEQLTRAPAR